MMGISSLARRAGICEQHWESSLAGAAAWCLTKTALRLFAPGHFTLRELAGAGSLRDWARSLRYEA